MNIYLICKLFIFFSLVQQKICIAVYEIKIKIRINKNNDEILRFILNVCLKKPGCLLPTNSKSLTRVYRATDTRGENISKIIK